MPFNSLLISTGTLGRRMVMAPNDANVPGVTRRPSAIFSAIVLLAFSLIALTASAQTNDAVLAIINGYEIKESDISDNIAGMSLGDQVAIRSNPDKFTESLIQEEVLFQFALTDNFDNDSALRESIKTTVVNHLIEKYVTSQMDVSDEEISDYFDNNTSAIRGETVQISHILTPTRAECEALLVRIDQGESFEELASVHSIHEQSAANGGTLGTMMNHDGPLGFEQQLFNLEINQPTLFDSEEGCHIMLVTGRETPPLPPLEAVAPAIEGLLRREKEIAAVQALIDRAHARVDVVRP